MKNFTHFFYFFAIFLCYVAPANAAVEQQCYFFCTDNQTAVGAEWCYTPTTKHPVTGAVMGDNAKFVNGELYVKVKPNFATELIATTPALLSKSPLRHLVQTYGISNTDRPFKRLAAMHQYYKVKFTNTHLTQQLIADLQKLPFVQFAEQVPEHRTFLTPNDIHPDQYNVTLTNCEQAWDVTTGSMAIKIGMVDDAVRTDHEDLSANIYTNPNEIDGNNIDDDANGYIDDVHGWDPASNDNDANPEGADNFSFSHGTHCAGIAAAVTNNNIGVASVSHNVSLVPIKTATDGSGSIAAGFEGVEYAIVLGVDVISMSWGGGGASATEQAFFDEAYADNIVVVAAAGNDNVSDPMYPASYNHVINVAAIDENDTKASFTNYGSTIDVSSPGVQIWSSVATSTNSYEFYDGTSMACPFVSGLCALMLSFDPNATVDRVEQCLKETADDIYTINPTFVGQLGAGRINAYEAVKCIPSEPVAAFAASAEPPCASEVVTFFDNSAGTDLTSWQWTFQNGTPATSTQQNPTVSFPSSGSYNVTLTVTNNLGSSTLTQTVVVAPPSATISGEVVMLLGYIIPATITFTGSPPYTFTYTDGVTPVTISNITQNPYLLPLSPTNNTIYTLVEMNNNSCEGTVSGSASYIVIIPTETNDLCQNALPFPDLTIGVESCVNGTTNGALAELPFINQSSCGNQNVPTPAVDVWFTFTAVANIADISLTFDMDTAVVAIYEGTCEGLIGRYCDISYDGTLNTTFAPADPGATYFIQVSGGSPTDQGNFTLCVDNYGESIDEICIFGQSLTAIPSPVLGTYGPNQAVTFCLTVDGYNANAVDWLHGIVPEFGSGWDVSTITGTISPPTCESGNGYWAWYNTMINGTGDNSPGPVGPGFFFEKTPGENNPANNFGDSGDDGCPWTFCFTISTVASCPPGVDGDNLTVEFQNYSDSESGSWNAPTSICPEDPNFVFKARLSCCPIPQMVGVFPSCASPTSGTVTATPSGGTAPFEIKWSTGDSVVINNGNSVIDSLSEGFYIVTITDNSGCVSEASFTLINNGSGLPITATEDAAICPGDEIQLQVTGDDIVEYLWYPSSSLNNNTIANPIATPTTSTEYFVIVTDDNGCTAYEQVLIAVLDPPTPYAGPNKQICPGSSTVLNASGGVSYAWSPTTGLSNPNIANPVANPTQTTVYTVTATGVNGCTATSQVSVVVVPEPFFPLEDIDTTVCTGQTVQFPLSDINFISNYNYQWLPTTGLSNPNIPNPIATITDDITYTIIVNNNYGCQTIRTITIDVQAEPLSVNLGADTLICSNNTLLLDPEGSYASYLWQDASTDTSFTVTQSGTYAVTVSNAIGCNAVDTILVDMATVTPDITGNLSIFYGENTILSLTSPFDTYLWSNSQTTPTITVDTSGVYTVTVTDENDCTATDQVTITLQYIEDLLIVNAFSPNNDGINDIFGAKNIDNNTLPSYSMVVYNRWGNKVFETKQISEGWDGKYKGFDAEMGVYAYYITAKFASGKEKIYKGNVSVIR